MAGVTISLGLRNEHNVTPAKRRPNIRRGQKHCVDCSGCFFSVNTRRSEKFQRWYSLFYGIENVGYIGYLYLISMAYTIMHQAAFVCLFYYFLMLLNRLGIIDHSVLRCKISWNWIEIVYYIQLTAGRMFIRTQFVLDELFHAIPRPVRTNIHLHHPRRG